MVDWCRPDCSCQQLHLRILWLLLHLEFLLLQQLLTLKPQLQLLLLSLPLLCLLPLLLRLLDREQGSFSQLDDHLQHSQEEGLTGGLVGQRHHGAKLQFSSALGLGWSSQHHRLLGELVHQGPLVLALLSLLLLVVSQASSSLQIREFPEQI